MRGLDLPVVVQDIAVRANKHLREMARRHINLTVAQRDICRSPSPQYGCAASRPNQRVSYFRGMP